MKDFILALDQGTSSCRAIVFDRKGLARGTAQAEFTQRFPRPGWVEHDAVEIWETQLRVAIDALRDARVSATEIAGVGITNQRETAVLWDRRTGNPVAPAIVWQDRRTSDLCEELRGLGHEPMIREKTGLVLDPYFSAGKLRWLLEEIPGARLRAGAGELAFGTVDAWLLWKLTGGRRHATDSGNAARTQLFNIHEQRWDPDLLQLFDIPPSVLPEVVPSCGALGEIDPKWFGTALPVTGMAGDQQAALFGQGCVRRGEAKNTYGTGCFLLMNTGTTPVSSSHGLLTTVAWNIGGEVTYALEGSVFIAGAAVQWLRDQICVIGASAEIEALAGEVPDSGGVVFVPAFSGLGAPHWDARTRGTVLGLSRGSGRAHLARATLDAIAWQSDDVLRAMAIDSGAALAGLRVDGGATANRLLMQIQADVSGISVERSATPETTALGVAFLAGLGAGLWSGLEEVGELCRTKDVFHPMIGEEARAKLRGRWNRGVAVARSADFLE